MEITRCYFRFFWWSRRFFGWWDQKLDHPMQ